MASRAGNKLHIRLILCLIIIGAVLIIARLYWLQVAHSAYYAEKADRQYASPSSGLFDRGTIYFTSKTGARVAAAAIKDGFVLAINPEKLVDAQSTYSKLSSVTPIDKAKFMASAAKKEDPYEELADNLDQAAGDKIVAMKITGVIVSKDAWRYYPTGSLAAQTVGIEGFATGTVQTGQYGLEREYNSALSRNDNDLSMNLFAQLFSGVSNVLEGQSLEGDIVTSIEPSIEGYLDKVLADTKAKWQSDSIGGIIMDPKTGAIYAMDSLPSFDPNNRSAVTDSSVFSNPLVQNVYEMGSIIKPLTMAAGIDSGAVTAASTYDDTGFIIVDGRKISNFDGKARGVIPMQQVLSQSLNVGAAHIALTMGSTTMKRYFLNYGLGSVTGIDLPSEQAGLVRNLTNGRDVNYATAAFGQGIALTPLETVRALSAIANGGYLVTPHVASEIDYQVGGFHTINSGPGLRVFSSTTADTVTNMLINVADKAISTAHPDISKPHYSIAAKTGTAQIADPAGGGYYADRYLHSFFGYFPAHDPRFIVFLYQVYPKNVQYASETLTDPFDEIADYLIGYYNIAPDR